MITEGGVARMLVVARRVACTTRCVGDSEQSNFPGTWYKLRRK